VEEGILPVVFEFVDADEFDDEDEDKDEDEDEEEEEDDDDDDDEEDDEGLDSLVTATAFESVLPLITSIPGPTSGGESTFLLFPRPSTAGVEVETDRFRAEVSALNRTLIISI
jgi:hypothetical protein